MSFSLRPLACAACARCSCADRTPARTWTKLMRWTAAHRKGPAPSLLATSLALHRNGVLMVVRGRRLSRAEIERRLQAASFLLLFSACALRRAVVTSGVRGAGEREGGGGCAGAAGRPPRRRQGPPPPRPPRPPRSI
eukprot:541913-Rhodomonas_salina.2